MSDWQDISTAPKDGTEIIVGVDVATVWIVRSARYVRADEWYPSEPDDVDGWWSYINSVSQEQLVGIYEPTHWMPQPAPPSPRTEGEQQDDERKHDEPVGGET